jgi:hypothetical protein
MLSALASVGARVFDLSITALNGAPVKGLQRPGRGLEDMRRTIGPVLQEAVRNQHNVIIGSISYFLTFFCCDCSSMFCW